MLRHRENHSPANRNRRLKKMCRMYSGRTSWKWQVSIFHWPPRSLGYTHRVEAVALVDGILVVRLELVKGNYVEDGEENQECIADQCYDVGEGRKRERHGYRESEYLGVSCVVVKSSSSYLFTATNGLRTRSTTRECF